MICEHRPFYSSIGQYVKYFAAHGWRGTSGNAAAANNVKQYCAQSRQMVTTFASGTPDGRANGLQVCGDADSMTPCAVQLPAQTGCHISRCDLALSSIRAAPLLKRRCLPT